MGIANSLFCYLLDYCFWDGSIFKNWRPFLERQVDKGKLKEFYYKILGGCIVCTNVWLGMISWLFIYFYTGVFDVGYGLVYIVVSNAYLRKLVGAVYNK